MRIYTQLEIKQIGRAELVAPDQLKNKLDRIINRHVPTAGEKILFAGPEGTGKTLAVSVLASELKQPVFTFLTDKYMEQDWNEASQTAASLETVIGVLGGIWHFSFPAESELKKLTDKVRKQYDRKIEMLLDSIQQLRYSGLVILEFSSPEAVPIRFLKMVDDCVAFSAPDTTQVSELLSRHLPGMNAASPEELDKLTACSHAEIISICLDANSRIEAGKTPDVAFAEAAEKFWFDKDVRRLSEDVKKIFGFW